MDNKDYEMELLKLRIKMIAELWQRLIRQGVLVAALFGAVFTLGYVVWFLYQENRMTHDEYDKRIRKAEQDVHECHMARIAADAVYREEIRGMREQIGALRELIRKQ